MLRVLSQLFLYRMIKEYKKMKKVLVLILSLTTLIFIAYFFYNVYQNNFSKSKKIVVNQTNKSWNVVQKSGKFSSYSMNFSVEIPSDLTAAEKLQHVEFRKDNNFISLDRTDATGFYSLIKYLADFDNKNKLKSPPIIVRDLIIDGNPGVIRMEIRGGVTVRMCYIYVDGWVYGFSTSSESLYSDLDQIAQSFKYIPN